MNKKLRFSEFLDFQFFRDRKLSEATFSDSPARKQLISNFRIDVDAEDENPDLQDLLKAFELIKKDCPKGYESFIEGKGRNSAFPLIYRGMDIDNAYTTSFYKVDYSKGTRIAENTYDAYRMLIDSNPNLQNYPKRSKAMIATTDIEYSLHYGAFYVIFPFTNSKIGIINEHDIFGTYFDFLGLQVNVSEMSRHLENGFDEDTKLSIGKQRTLESFKADIEKIGGIKSYIKNMRKSYIKRMYGSDDFDIDEQDSIDLITVNAEKLMKSFNFHDIDSFLNYIWNDVLNEKNLKFELSNGASFYSRESGYNSEECWISGDCYMLGPFVDESDFFDKSEDIVDILNRDKNEE